MGCLAVILIILVIAAYVMYAVGMVLALDAVFFILFIASIYSYSKVSKIKASTMKCSNCNSTNVKLSAITAGTTDEGVKRQRIATCQDCGFEWNYITPDDVSNTKASARGRIYLFGILFAACAAFTFYMFGLGNTNKDRINETETENIDVSETHVEKDYGKIEDFEYELSGDSVLLKRYKGESDILELCPSYKIDGKEYVSDISDFQISSNSVKTFIMQNGFVETRTAIFNGSEVEKIFFPESMDVVYDYTLSYLHPDEGKKIQIYYGGTKEEWDKIFTEYTTIQQTDSTAEAIGSAAGDFLNGLIGVEYKPELFEYHFSAKIETMK